MEIIGEFQTSLIKALREIDPEWFTYRGLIVCGTHSPWKFNVDSIIEKITKARVQHIPFLGICWGHQLAAIEYARNILNIKDATSEELGEGTFVVKKRKELLVGQRYGESYWSNYVVDPSMLWEEPDNFITVPFHPEYQSSMDKPHPVLVDFLNLCK